MNRQKLFIRFKKEGDLRLISHRDLARVFERLFRRVQLPLAMSEGFHPHPKISFPSALALGIEGKDEIVVVILDEPVDLQNVRLRLNNQSPDGLVIDQVQELEPGQKATVNGATYEVRIPHERIDALQKAMAEFLDAASFHIERSNGQKTVDIRPGVQSLELIGDLLRMKIPFSQEFSVKPRELMTALQIQDLETQGAWLTRSELYLHDDPRHFTSRKSQNGLHPRDSNFESERNQT